ncbi:MAG TPA: Ig-like domain-containing protein, partial [Allosphingosinicella sp.]|nr:Ig-like domain-containing protein [Allosphingosinicella sp.]
MADPVALDDVNAATEDGAIVTGNVGANDTDADMNIVSFAVVGPPPPGLTFNPDGSYLFNPLNAAYQHLAQGATQLVTVTYVVTDGTGGTDTATLTITVTGTNDAPVAADDTATA